MVRSSKRQTVRRQYRQWRAAVDLSQLDTAERAGMTRERYWKIENGYEQPTAAEQSKLARVFQIETELFAGSV